MRLFASCFGHDEDYDGGSYGSGSSRRASPRQGRRVTKAMIGTPTNFMHTGHLGINNIQQGAFPSNDADRFRQVMSQVGAVLDEDMFSNVVSKEDQSHHRPNNVGVVY